MQNDAPRWPLRRRIGRVIGWVLLIPFAYAAAGIIGAAIPANSGWRQAEQGVAIWVEDNGIHTGIVMPVTAHGIDWRHWLSPSDVRDPRYAAHTHVAFGWGDREFYVNTPRWADVQPKTVVAAAVGGGPTVLYVERIAEPRPAPHVRRVILRPDEYRRLAAYIAATFRMGPDGRPVGQFGYGAHDSFYDAHGRYSAFATCNVWTGRALRHAGVRLGRWTPFSVTILSWL